MKAFLPFLPGRGLPESTPADTGGGANATAVGEKHQKRLIYLNKRCLAALLDQFGQMDNIPIFVPELEDSRACSPLWQE